MADSAILPTNTSEISISPHGRTSEMVAKYKKPGTLLSAGPAIGILMSDALDDLPRQADLHYECTS
ncbi:hypothetical protein LXA47_17030 [Massilia sp. P8910]|uniref:hypothetical protein n=1 Tax=Massilia antarctica TaxID=2765360 RepID=UPI0011AF77DD|nr:MULTISPECIES: hypothetical protein [Massilia]MCE3605296.1 hypothetical protein [Massilia antarctica]MCY0914119.1 hypothetical protein [Massilia sp. H27-R4]